MAITSADAATTQTVILPSPSSTGWDTATESDTLLTSSALCPSVPRRQSISSTPGSIVIDLTANEAPCSETGIDPDSNPTTWNNPSSPNVKFEAINLVEDLHPVPGESQTSAPSLHAMAEVAHNVPVFHDRVQDLQLRDELFNSETQYEKFGKGSIFSKIDLTYDSPDETPQCEKESRSLLNSWEPSPHDIQPVSLELLSSPTPTTLKKEADFDTSMPRILPRLGQPSSIDLVKEESSGEDDKQDVITGEELNVWLESQKGRDSRLGKKGKAPTTSGSRKHKPTQRNTFIEHPSSMVETYTYNGIVLRPGVNVELQDSAFIGETDEKGIDEKDTEGTPQNGFMRIVDIIQDSRSQAVTLRGWVFQRTQYLNGVLEKKRNEVCWVMHVDEDDPRDFKTQSMETVPVSDVLRRRKIRLTNQPWPKLSFREDPHMLKDSEETIRNERVLVCRFKYVCHYVCAKRRAMNFWSERVLQRLRHADCDKWAGPEGEPCALEDAKLREAWRGETVAGGAYQEKEDWHEQIIGIANENIIDLTEKIVKRDPDDWSSIPRDAGCPFSITSIATRVDWISDDGTEYYTVSGHTPAKRRAETELPSGPTKRHQLDESLLCVERSPEIKPLHFDIRRRSPVFEVPPEDRMTEPVLPKAGVSNAGRLASASKKRQYTFGDSFCGAGGMSRAAHQAGLHIKYAFDCNERACDSYAMNFPKANLHCRWAHEFIQTPGDRTVDIAHLSPPCQFFSPAHTRAGKDDEMNTASLFAVGEMLLKSRPRVVTLEQTFGIVLRARHQGYLNALVQIFTRYGFSIRWRLLHCADYGLPQMRLRTFVIASCPGEPLPPFPQPTHSSLPSLTGLLPWTTINSIIDSIPPDALDHEPEKCKVRDELPRSGDRIAKTITCNGGGQVHPSGKRDFTIREFATLQGFPLEHVFGAVGAKKQIGNAVPPPVGRRVLESVVEALEKEDGVRRGG
ncbi:MAG: hypothetical protein Q9170_006303 [Blastenia crenularia]